MRVMAELVLLLVGVLPVVIMINERSEARPRFAAKWSERLFAFANGILSFFLFCYSVD